MSPTSPIPPTCTTFVAPHRHDGSLLFAATHRINVSSTQTKALERQGNGHYSTRNHQPWARPARSMFKTMPPRGYHDTGDVFMPKTMPPRGYHHTGDVIFSYDSSGHSVIVLGPLPFAYFCFICKSTLEIHSRKDWLRPPQGFMEFLFLNCVGGNLPKLGTYMHSFPATKGEQETKSSLSRSNF